MPVYLLSAKDHSSDAWGGREKIEQIVVRAADEGDARRLAGQAGGQVTMQKRPGRADFDPPGISPWRSPEHTTGERLDDKDEPAILLVQPPR